MEESIYSTYTSTLFGEIEPIPALNELSVPIDVLSFGNFLGAVSVNENIKLRPPPPGGLLPLGPSIN